MSPLWVRVSALLAGGFAGRRRVVRAWCAWDVSHAATVVRNLRFRLRHPVLMRQVDRRVRLLRQGRDELEA